MLTLDTKPSTLTFAVILTALIGAFGMGIFLGVEEAPAHASLPQALRVANVRDTQFTVSWTSSGVEHGQVRYGTDPRRLGGTAYDDRGAATQDDTHHVTVTGLMPETVYYFDVVSGAVTDNNGGAHYTVTTGPTMLPPVVPDQV